MVNEDKREHTKPATVRAGDFDAVLFDMDGVVTRTADTHAAAWKQLFDEYGEERKARGLDAFAPFDIELDYRQYVDGRPRYDGATAFLVARGIVLPWGQPTDSETTETVCGLGNRKEKYFWARLERERVETYPDALDLVRRLKNTDQVRTGLFSASRNATRILAAAGIADLFDGTFDGQDLAALGLPGKPDPAMLLELARRLGAEPARCLVFEDAIAGVEAGRAGRFGMVIGVNRSFIAGTLVQHGADIEVRDLREVVVHDF